MKTAKVPGALQKMPVRHFNRFSANVARASTITQRPERTFSSPEFKIESQSRFFQYTRSRNNFIFQKFPNEPLTCLSASSMRFFIDG